MEVKSVYLQHLSFAKNPSKLGEKAPENFRDLHESTVRYDIISENWQKEGKAAVVRIGIRMEPKDKEKGFVNYIATYRVVIEDVKGVLKKEVIELATNTAWDRIHADYVKSFNELELPTYGFPVKPILPEKDKDTAQKKT